MNSQPTVVGLIATCCVASSSANSPAHRYRPGAGFLLAVTGCSPVLLVPALGFSDVMAALNRSPTLSGPRQIWDLALMYIDRRPWLGYGYGSFFRVGGVEANQMQAIMDWPVPTVHNASNRRWG